MKDLTTKEFLDAPALIMHIYRNAMCKIPMGASLIERGMKEHPEYFPDEMEHRRKWEAIPQSVHDEYWKERTAIHTKVFKNMPGSKGILGWANDPEGYLKWSKQWEKCRKKELPLIEKLHNKFYSKYGIEWGGW